jgi:MSHA biogenesis protein MshQ
VVKPHSYLITLSEGETGSDYEAINATDTVYTKAGVDFNVTVTAKGSDGVTTPNYGKERPAETVHLNHELVQPKPGAEGDLIFNLSKENYGIYSGTANWSEVGIINLTATVGDAHCLDTGDVSSTLSNVGRFTPASLSLTVINHGTFISANTDGALNFTYVGQPFSYDPADRTSLKATALNASSPATLTSNYSEAWGKLNAASIEFTEPTSDEIQHGTLKPNGTSTRMVLTYAQGYDGFRDLKNTDNPPAAVNGIFDATFTDNEFTYDKGSYSQISSFKPNINLIIISVTDSDGISTGSITLNPTGPEFIRFGRMRMNSAHGLELKSLEMAYRLEYSDSPNWLLHDDEDSTIATGDISSEPIGISATSIELTMPEGKFYITLSPPTDLENGGTSSITTDVGEDEPGSGKHWLRYDWENDGNFVDNPSSTATFGIYKGNSHQIFSR